MDGPLWILAWVLVVAGIAGTFLPALPGAPLVLAGLVLAAWLDDFARVSGWTVALLVLLTAASFVVEFMASAMGAKRVGASRWAIAGAVAGGLVGLFFGLPGLVLGPFLGAGAAEYVVLRDWRRAGKVGVGTAIGMAFGLAAKVAIVVTMLGVFALAYLV